MRAKLALRLVISTDTVRTFYFNFPVCEYHKWPDEQVDAFFNENWESILKGFGLDVSLGKSATCSLDWVPWWKAVEFWRKAQAKEAKKKETVH